MYDQFPSTYLTGVNKMNVDKIENLLTNQKVRNPILGRYPFW